MYESIRRKKGFEQYLSDQEREIHHLRRRYASLPHSFEKIESHSGRSDHFRALDAGDREIPLADHCALWILP